MTQQPLEIRLYENLASLESLRKEWEALLSEFPAATTFSTWEWLVPWWRAFGKGQQLRVLGFFDTANRLVTLAPLSLTAHRAPGGLMLKLLRMMGDGSQDSDNLDMPVRAGYEIAAGHALLDWLEEHRRDWDLCRLNTLPSDSPVGNEIIREVKSRGWTCFTTSHPRLIIELPESWESYLKTLSSKERGKIGYLTRRLEKLYPVGIYRCTGADQLEACLEALFELHSKHWQARGSPGSFQSGARRQFYREMGALLIARGHLQLWLLQLNGKTVAAQFGFRHRDTVHTLQEGFDPTHASDSVGYVLRSQVLKQLISEGVRYYDFLGGTDPSKLRWGPQQRNYLNIDFARPYTGGSAYLILTHRGADTKNWLRARLSHRVWQALKTAAGIRTRR